MPINLKVIKAQQELQYALDRITVKYQLPGCIIDLILEAVRAKEMKDQLTFLAMQIDDNKGDDNGEGKSDDTGN